MTDEMLPSFDPPVEGGDNVLTTPWIDELAESDNSPRLVHDDDLIVGQVLESVINSSEMSSPKQATSNIHSNQTGSLLGGTINTLTETMTTNGPLEQDGMLEEDTQSPESYQDSVIEVEPTKECPEDDTDKVLGEPQEILDESQEFVIERILDKKLNNEGQPLWLVKWRGYPASGNTWEPLEHIIECDNFVQDFEIARAKLIAQRHDPDLAPNGSNSNQSGQKRRQMTPKHKEYEILDIMGLTMIDNEKYFLVTMANSTTKGFIRASLANRIIPKKVIDFYIKNLQWKSASSTDISDL